MKSAPRGSRRTLPAKHVAARTAANAAPPTYHLALPQRIDNLVEIDRILYEAAETGRSSRELPSYWPCKHDRLATSNRKGGSKELE